jgi:hypothetical protein
VDYVFVDAQHTYPACLQDIQAWLPKVQVSGGFIGGHDWHCDTVKQAVKEVFSDFEIIDNCWLATVDKKEAK